MVFRRISNWHMGLYLIVVGAFALRVFSVLHWYRHPVIWGDTFYYHNAANLLVEGKGFINPFSYFLHHQTVPTADFPPLYIFYLSAASLVGAKSYFAHEIWTCFLGTATVALVGLAAREVAGKRVGILAAALAAVYPNIWINDGLVHAESMSMFMVALMVLVSYRFWRNPRALTALTLGVVIGLSALARDELLLLVPLVMLPLTLLARYRPGSVPVPAWEGSSRLLPADAAVLGAGVSETADMASPGAGAATQTGDFDGAGWRGPRLPFKQRVMMLVSGCLVVVLVLG